jgi:hypothetical protein
MFGGVWMGTKRSAAFERVLSADMQGQRRFPRAELECTVLLFRRGEAKGIKAKAQDISGHGLYCISPEPFSPNEQVECDVIIPAENGNTLVLRFQGHVVRVVAGASGSGFGVACSLTYAPVQ